MKIALIYIQSILLGTIFTTIPAAANFLTSPEGLGFSMAQYSSLFVPMIVAAILSSFFGGYIAQRFSNKFLLLVGTACLFVSMMMISTSSFKEHPYAVMMGAMAILGIGFGATMTAINPWVFYFFPNRTSAALLANQVSFGIGTVFSPFLLNLFLEIEMWWMDFATLGVLSLLLCVLHWIFLPQIHTEKAARSAYKTGMWIFAVVSFFYGMTETTFGNWATIYLYNERGVDIITANNALAIFWGSLTIGRILFMLLVFICPPRIIYRTLPLVVLGALAYIQLGAHPIIGFALAGFGCSAIFPLVISFAQTRFPPSAAFVSGLTVSSNLIGYGFSAQVVGLLVSAFAITLHSIYLWLLFLVLILAIFCYLSSRDQVK